MSLLSEDTASGLVAEAQEAINMYLLPGLGAKNSIDHYSLTSDKYEAGTPVGGMGIGRRLAETFGRHTRATTIEIGLKYLAAFDCTGPQKTAATLAELYPPDIRETIKVLDVAAGTGRLGKELHALGFRQMDALDPSQGMLGKAQEKGVYGRLINEPIGDTRVDIDDDLYDALVVCGGMGENHIPCSALKEMVRVVKPGGYIVNVTRVEHLNKCSDYVGRLEPLMQKLEDDGKWRTVSRGTFPNALRGKEGLVLVHQVL